MRPRVSFTRPHPSEVSSSESGVAPPNARTAPLSVWSKSPSTTGPPSSGLGIQTWAEGLEMIGRSQAVTMSG